MYLQTNAATHKDLELLSLGYLKEHNCQATQVRVSFKKNGILFLHIPYAFQNV